MAKKKEEEVAPAKEKKTKAKATKKTVKKVATKKTVTKKAAPKKKVAKKKVAKKTTKKAAPKKKEEAPPEEPKEAPTPKPVKEVPEIRAEEELPPPPPPEEEPPEPEPEEELPPPPPPEVEPPPPEEEKPAEVPPEEETPAEPVEAEAPEPEAELPVEEEKVPEPEPEEKPPEPEPEEKPPEPEPKEEIPVEEEPKKEEAPPKKEKKPPEGDVPLLYNRWDFTEVEVEDMGLRRYINLTPIYLPHTGAKHANKRFGREKVNIVERLINNTMRTERFTGKKSKAYSTVKKAFEIIEKKTKTNPIQVLVHALQNAAPREEITRLRFGGISVPRAVDIAPSRRLDIAMRNICKGAVASTHKNKKPIEACLASEILLAANEDITSFSISRKEELERVAVSAR
jgi:small subunit ribosomal protein S7